MIHSRNCIEANTINRRATAGCPFPKATKAAAHKTNKKVPPDDSAL
jgi:hypothetical protein